MRPDVKPRVVIYVRVSTQEQSTRLQREEISSYLDARGWKASYQIEDVMSGALADRPGFNNVMRLARMQKFDFLVIWRLDRLFRSLSNLVLTVSEFESLGISLISVKDALDFSTPTGRLMVNLIGSFAEFERDLLRSRVKAGIASKRRLDPRWGPKPKITPKDAKLLRDQGCTIREIATRLRVSPATIHKALKVFTKPVTD